MVNDSSAAQAKTMGSPGAVLCVVTGAFGYSGKYITSPRMQWARMMTILE
jgi:hypothetical protein